MLMQPSTKQKILTFFLLLALYIACVSAPPYGTGVQRDLFLALYRAIFCIVAILLLAYEKHRLPGFKLSFFCFLFVPAFFGNLISLLFFHSNEIYFDGIALLASTLSMLLASIAEEILFRYVLFDLLEGKMRPIFKILISAGAFALIHLLNLLSGMNPLEVLAQIGYAFFLGLICGLVHHEEGFYQSVFIHFAFNFLQTSLYLALGGGIWDISFFVANIACGLFGIAVWIIIAIRRRLLIRK